MNTDLKDRILEIITSAPADRSNWIEANTQNSGIQRRAFMKAKMHLDNFIKTPSNNNWLIMPGLRGIGKTTILTQLYNQTPSPNNRKFFISLERVRLIGGSMEDVIDVIEEVAGEKLDSIDEPIYIYLDEVQYLDNWSLSLKTVFDRTRKIFIACTGSSAIALQTNPDIARRSLKIPIHPLCFTEYVMIRQSTEGLRNITFPDTGLAKELKKILFDSANEQEVYIGIQNLRLRISNYWRRLDDRQSYVNDYVKFGTLPFTLHDTAETIRWQKINALLTESLARDVDSTEKFDSATRSMFPRLLFLLASSDVISHANIASTLNINVRTLISMLDTLVKTEIIHPILPRGSAYKQVSQPIKYLFTSPAIRTAICTSGGILGEERASHLRGRLLEDVVGMYLKRIFNPSETPAIVEYDYGSGGADFIVSRTGQKGNSIAIEVGVKKRTAQQTHTTLKRIDAKYGLIISGANLSIDSSKKSVFVPFEPFLLT